MWLHAGFFWSNESNSVGWCCQACSLDDMLLWSKMATEHPFFNTSLMAIYTAFSCDIHLYYLVGGLEHFLFSIYWECHHSNWLIFFRGVGGSTTNQITFKIMCFFVFVGLPCLICQNNVLRFRPQDLWEIGCWLCEPMGGSEAIKGCECAIPEEAVRGLVRWGLS